VVPANGNLAFAQALVEQMSGETDLVNARARAVLTRPFVRINEMEAQAAQEYIGRVGELEENLQQTQKKLQELQDKRGPNASTTLLSPEQQAELDEFRKRSAETRRELKNLRRELRADSEALQFNTRVINIALMPVLVVVFGLLMYAARRRRVVAI
jgi:ABC-type uncharacterized transport system involved in gliding motility auxiliary subunit